MDSAGHVEREAARACPGCDDEAIPGQLSPVAQGRNAVANGDHPTSQHELDPVLLPEEWRSQRELLGSLPACEKVLRERGSLVRRHLFGSDEDDAPGKTACTQRLGAARPCKTGARDH